MIPFEEKDTRNLLAFCLDIDFPFIKQKKKYYCTHKYNIKHFFNVNDIIHFKEADVRNVLALSLFTLVDTL